MPTIRCRWYFTMPSGYICDIRDCRVTHRPVTQTHTEHVVTYHTDDNSVMHEVLSEDNYYWFVQFSAKALSK